MALDFDQTVTAVASQPFWLLWHEGTVQRRHAPDFFARLSGGGAVVIDSRPAARVRESDAEAFAATGQACELLGWDYVVWDVLDPVVAGNLRWPLTLSDVGRRNGLSLQTRQRLPVFAGPAAAGSGPGLLRVGARTVAGVDVWVRG